MSDDLCAAAQTWPGWAFTLAPLPGEHTEYFDNGRQVVTIDPKGRELGHLIRHACAHLELGHHLTPGAAFSAEQEGDADWLADIRDLADFPVDGEPTVTR